MRYPVLLAIAAVVAFVPAGAAQEFVISRPAFVIVKATPPRCICGPGCDCFECPKDCAPRAAAPAATAPAVPPVYYRPAVQAPPPIFQPAFQPVFQSFRGGGC